MALDNQENMQDARVSIDSWKSTLLIFVIPLVRVTPSEEKEKYSEIYVAGNNRSDLKVAFYFSE